MNWNGWGRKWAVYPLSSWSLRAATWPRPPRLCISLAHHTTSCSAPAFQQTHLDIWVRQRTECVGSEPTWELQGCSEYSWHKIAATRSVYAWSSCQRIICSAFIPTHTHTHAYGRTQRQGPCRPSSQFVCSNEQSKYTRIDENMCGEFAIEMCLRYRRRFELWIGEAVVDPGNYEFKQNMN